MSPDGNQRHCGWSILVKHRTLIPTKPWDVTMSLQEREGMEKDVKHNFYGESKTEGNATGEKTLSFFYCIW